MESRSFPSVHYVKFSTTEARQSVESELVTLGDLLSGLPEETANRYLTEKPKEYMMRPEQNIDSESILVETMHRHDPSDRDIDEVLEPPQVPRDSPQFLKEAWKPLPIRRLNLAPRHSPEDEEKRLYIRILRVGGDFHVTYYGEDLGVMHVLTNDDLTMLKWQTPRNHKNRKEMNVFEFLAEAHNEQSIVLGTMRDKAALKLEIADSNTLERLLDAPLDSPGEKIEIWSGAFRSLVKMELQPSLYRS